MCHIYNVRKGLITAKKLVYPLARKEYDQKMKCREKCYIVSLLFS